MRKTKFLTFVFGLFLVGLIIYFTYSIVNWKHYSKNIKPGPSPSAVEITASPDINSVQDYVCGMKLDKRTATFKEKYLDYEFYFCSEECRDKFSKDPLKYIPIRIKLKIKPVTPSDLPDGQTSTPLPEITLEDLNQPPATPTATSTDDQNYPDDTIEVIPGGEDTPVPTKTVEIQDDI